MKALRLKNHHLHPKLPDQKSMLIQIEWWVQNEPITKNGLFSVTTLFFWKFYFSLKTSCKEMIWCINDPNAHQISTFCKCCSVISRSFFPVSIIKIFFYSLSSYQTNKRVTVIELRNKNEQWVWSLIAKLRKSEISLVKKFHIVAIYLFSTLYLRGSYKQTLSYLYIYIYIAQGLRCSSLG